MNTINPAISALELAEALKNCEREAIHQVGLIQPTGVLIALDDDDLLITHVSENIGVWFPYSPNELLGKPFSTLVGSEQAQSIRQLVGLKDWRHTAITTFTIEQNGATVSLDAQISHTENLWLVEIEQQV